MNFIEKLKHRWGVSKALDVFVILLVFTCTGFTSLYVKTPLFEALGLTNIEPKFLRGIIYVISIIIFYNMLLLVFGFVFGKFQFFFSFEKRFFARMVYLFRNKQK